MRAAGDLSDSALLLSMRSGRLDCTGVCSENFDQVSEALDKGPRPQASASHRYEARLQLLITEYEWVAGLIRYHREVELKALAAAGLVLSAVAAAFAALQAGGSDAQQAEGPLLAVAAWIPALLVPVIVMANLRGLRAVLYVRLWLFPLAADLTGDPRSRYLAWEVVAKGIFAERFGAKPSARGDPNLSTRPTVRSRVAAGLVSTALLVVLVALAAIALGVAASFVHPTVGARIAGALAAALAAGFAIAGVLVASESEERRQLPLGRRAELEARAVNLASEANNPC
jgi:hypothetical protein